MIRLGLALIWLLHFLPRVALSRVGAAVGWALYGLAAARRRVVLKNLQLCFPHLTDGERQKLALAHFRAFGCSLLAHGILWWGSRAEVDALVRIEGLDHWRSITAGPVI